MKKSIQIFALLLVFNLGWIGHPAIGAAINTQPATVAKQEQQENHNTQTIQRFADSDMVKWMIRRAEKRQVRLEEKLAKAEAKQDVKKVEKIKEKLKPQADLKKLGITLMIVGGVMVVVGIVLAYTLISFGLAGLIYGLGSLAFVIGLILWLVSIIQEN